MDRQHILEQGQFQQVAEETNAHKIAELQDTVMWLAANLEKLASGKVEFRDMRKFAKNTLRGMKAICHQDLK